MKHPTAILVTDSAMGWPRRDRRRALTLPAQFGGGAKQPVPGRHHIQRCGRAGDRADRLLQKRRSALPAATNGRDRPGQSTQADRNMLFLSSPRIHEALAMDRRHLLKSALYAAPLFTAGRLYAAPVAGPRLLVVFLRGAYDAANIVIPTSAATSIIPRGPISLAIAQRCRPAAGRRLGPASGFEGLHLCPCGSKSRSPLCPSPAPTTPRARISRPRIRSSWDSRLAADAQLPVRLSERAPPQGSCRASKPAHRLHQPAAADLSRRPAHSQHRAQRPHRQARGGRPQCGADPGVCTRARTWRRQWRRASRCRDEVYQAISQDRDAWRPTATRSPPRALNCRHSGSAF